VFFLVASEDVQSVKDLLGGKLRRTFAAGKHREIAIDWGRFYAVTSEILENVPETFSTVRVEDVEWFLNTAGPHYQELHGVSGGGGGQNHAGRDDSGSGHGFRFMRDCRARGMDYEEASAAILADTGEAGAWARRVDKRQLYRAWEAAAAGSHAETRPLVYRRIDEFERRDIEWLWYPFIPRGMITLICGDKAVGKSSVAIDVAARISKGRVWPRFGDDSEERAPKGSVIILCKENDISRIIRPRLEAAEADIRRILTLGYEVPDDPEQIDPLERLDTTVKELEQQLDDIGDVRLIVIDPITDYVGKIDMNRDNQVRTLLNPLGRLASRHDLAILNILHLNKKEDSSPRYRALGSVGFRNVSQSTIMVAANSNCPGERFMAQDAANLCKETRSVTFSMCSVRSYHRIEWGGHWEEADLDEIMADKRQSKQQQAQRLLREWLADGPVPVEDLQSLAKEQGISWRTMLRVKDEIGVVSDKPRGTLIGGWVWKLAR